MKQRPFGEHWEGVKGYRVIKGIDGYKHNFGGQGCECLKKENEPWTRRKWRNE